MSRNLASAKAAGRGWERAICDYLVGHGWPAAERRRLGGSADRGDVAGIPELVIEAKNTNGHDLAAAVDQANRERLHADARHGVAWLKRRGFTSPARGYVVMDGATFVELLKEAGYRK